MIREKLLSGKFTITAEISPPKGTDVNWMMKEAGMIKNAVDALCVTDNQRAIMRMSPIAACSALLQHGYETIMHLTCRDRNRLALQSELLGAAGLGIKNILVMSGDYPTKGDHPGAKPVYDLDSVQLLDMISRLNKGVDLSGNRLEGKTEFFAGAVSNTELTEVALMKLEKKIKAGAHFIITQAVFDPGKFSEFLDQVHDAGGKKIKIIAGIIPLRSRKTADFLNRNIAGVKVPDNVIKRLSSSSDPGALGIEMAADMIKELREICDGVHIMPVGTHENTRKILEMAGL
ncbi:MAG: methylenetetrahydrofolate reductase [Candidatus Methanoperedens sp.]|nr:methylenetetrahydrofolate reductase [Candidatus Methanoperedens sp.]